MEVRVVLVEPRYWWNVGSVARVMKNFGYRDLWLVSPPPGPRDDALTAAVHARDVLEAARVVGDLDEALSGASLVAATTSRVAGERKFHRRPIPPRELARISASEEGILALLFGSEDFGLRNEVVSSSDLVVTIPTSPEYPSMNLSHAVAVVLYELRVASMEAPPFPVPRAASHEDRERLMSLIRSIMEATGLWGPRLRRYEAAVRRVLGRASPTIWEYHALMGVARRVLLALGGEPE